MGDGMPRRKYGHMVGACPPTPKEKCRACRLGNPCPIHDESSIDYKALARKKRRKHSGSKKGKKRQKKKRKPEGD
jgi:hypothetical protein